MRKAEALQERIHRLDDDRCGVVRIERGGAGGIEFVERELGVSRPTAGKYLEQLTTAGLVRKQRMGKTNFYINEPLFALLSNVTLERP